MLILIADAKCDKCNKQLDLVEGMEWIPNHGLYCQPCADKWNEFLKHLAEIEKERNRED